MYSPQSRVRNAEGGISLSGEIEMSGGTMSVRLRILPILAALGLCACGFRGFLAPESGQVNGHVYLAETGAVIPEAEVCAFGKDTTCVHANEDGFYRLYTLPQVADLRYRFSTKSPAGIIANVHISKDTARTLDCTLTGAVALNNTPVPCLPPPAKRPSK